MEGRSALAALRKSDNSRSAGTREYSGVPGDLSAVCGVALVAFARPDGAAAFAGISWSAGDDDPLGFHKHEAVGPFSFASQCRWSDPVPVQRSPSRLNVAETGTPRDR